MRLQEGLSVEVDGVQLPVMLTESKIRAPGVASLFKHGDVFYSAHTEDVRRLETGEKILGRLYGFERLRGNADDGISGGRPQDLLREDGGTSTPRRSDNSK